MKPLRWRSELSFWFHPQQRHERARHHARRASEALIKRQYGVALAESAVTLIAWPRMARDRLIYGWLAEKALKVFERLAVLR